MSESKNEKPPAEAVEPVNAPTPEEAEALVRSIGLVYTNATLYGLNHKVTKKSSEDSFVLLSKALETYSELNFNITDDVMMVNGTAVDSRNPVTDSFIRHLIQIEVPSFSIDRGLAADKFADVIELLNAKPDELKQLGGFASILVSANIEHVRAKKMVYKRIAEDDVVLSKEKMAGIASVTGGDIDSVVAFLKSDGRETPPHAAANIKRVAADSGQLGKLIVDTAEAAKKEEKAGQSEKGLTDLVVNSLERVFSELSKDPSAKTQKGKKDLEKTLSMLEGAVCHRIAEISGEVKESDNRAISQAVEGMVDELRIDALVGEYMKKREALGKNEERLLRFMKTKGLDRLSDSELEGRMLAGGLTPEG